MFPSLITSERSYHTGSYVFHLLKSQTHVEEITDSKSKFSFDFVSALSQSPLQEELCYYRIIPVCFLFV